MDNKVDEDIKLKALIADDDIPTRMLLRTAMTQWGYEVIEASNGEEAWQILQAPNRPHLLVVDWMMPVMDGLSLCKSIREKLPGFSYVILLTQLTGSTNINQALEAGADEFLSKPFNMAELRNRLMIGTRIIAYEKQIKKYQLILDAIKQLKDDRTTERSHEEASQKLLKILKEVE